MFMKYYSYIKLAAYIFFSVAGIFCLFYMVMHRGNLFGRSMTVKAIFSNVQGLQVGNNVRYAGMQIGVVDDIYLLNDSAVEVSMTINKKMQNYIRRSAVVSISSDGFVGDKLISILPGSGEGPLIQNNDQLLSVEPFDVNQLMISLKSSEGDIIQLFDNINSLMTKVNGSNEFWNLVSSKKAFSNVESIMSNLKESSMRANSILSNVESVVADVNSDKGLIGNLLGDSSFSLKVDTILQNTSLLVRDASSAIINIRQALDSIQDILSSRNSILKTILIDSVFNKNIEESVISIQAGTKSFNEVMSALKRSIFIRRAIKRDKN